MSTDSCYPLSPTGSHFTVLCPPTGCGLTGPTGSGPTIPPHAMAPLPPNRLWSYCPRRKWPHCPHRRLLSAPLAGTDAPSPGLGRAGTWAPYCTEEEEENPLIDSRQSQLFEMGRRPSSTESLTSHFYCELFKEAQSQISPCVTSSWESCDSATPALNTVHCLLTLNTAYSSLNTWDTVC